MKTQRTHLILYADTIRAVREEAARQKLTFTSHTENVLRAFHGLALASHPGHGGRPPKVRPGAELPAVPCAFTSPCGDALDCPACILKEDCEPGAEPGANVEQGATMTRCVNCVHKDDCILDLDPETCDDYEKKT